MCYIVEAPQYKQGTYTHYWPHQSQKPVNNTARFTRTHSSGSQSLIIRFHVSSFGR